MLQVRETSAAKHLLYGRTVVSTSAIPLTAVTGPCNRGVLIRAPGLAESDANSEIVYVGDENVTTSTGFPICPGAAIELPIIDPSKIYVITTGTQRLAWMGI